MNLTDILKIEKIEKPEQAVELFRWISDTNETKYNLTKAAEELNELSEVLLKIANKKTGQQPPVQHVVDEIGDVLTRIEMIQRCMSITDATVYTRILYKANKYLGYIKEKKYNNGI